MPPRIGGFAGRGNATKGETMKNEERGNTIAFETPEQLAKIGPAAIPAPIVPGVQGSNFKAITSKSIEFSASVKETIPESVSLDRLKSNAMARLNGEYGPL
jgi:hypothetical protein